MAILFSARWVIVSYWFQSVCSQQWSCYLINIIACIYYDCCVVQYNDKFDQELNSNEFKFLSNYQVLLTSVWGKHRVYCWHNPFAVFYFILSSKTVKETNRVLFKRYNKTALLLPNVFLAKCCQNRRYPNHSIFYIEFYKYKLKC